MERELIAQLEVMDEFEQNFLDGFMGAEPGVIRTIPNKKSKSDKALADSRLIGAFKHARFWECSDHGHDHIEITYVLKGSVTHIMNGTDRVVLEAGDMLFMNTHVNHSVKAAGMNDLMMVFVTQPKFFIDILAHIPPNHKFAVFINNALGNDNDGANYLIYRQLDEVCKSLVMFIYKDAQEREFEAQLSAQLLMQVLLINLLRKKPSRDLDAQLTTEETISVKIHSYLEGNYQTASLGDLAAIIPCTPNYLSKMIKRATGMNFRELLTDERMKVAAKLIKNSDLPITDIAENVGYSNKTFFYNLFRQSYGCTPKEYRYRG